MTDSTSLAAQIEVVAEAFERWWEAKGGRFVDVNSLQGRQRKRDAFNAFCAAWNTRATDQQALAERDAEIARLRELVDQAAQIIGQIELDHRYPPAPDSMDRRIERARFWLHVYAALGGTDAE